MLRQCEAKLGDGLAAIGEQAIAERWIDPGSRDDTCPILWNPLFLSEVVQLLDSLGRVHSTRVERGLNRFNPLLNGGGALNDAIVAGHVLALVMRRSCAQLRVLLVAPYGSIFAVGSLTTTQNFRNEANAEDLITALTPRREAGQYAMQIDELSDAAQRQGVPVRTPAPGHSRHSETPCP